MDVDRKKSNSSKKVIKHDDAVGMSHEDSFQDSQRSSVLLITNFTGAIGETGGGFQGDSKRSYYRERSETEECDDTLNMVAGLARRRLSTHTVRETSAQSPNGARIRDNVSLW